jgi:hypothetical protein
MGSMEMGGVKEIVISGDSSVSETYFQTEKGFVVEIEVQFKLFPVGNRNSTGYEGTGE